MSGEEKDPRRTLAGRFARAVILLRWPIVVAWVAAAVAATTLLPTIREAQTGSLGDLVPNDADAIAAEERGFELFGLPLLSRTLVVQRDPGGLSFDEQLDAVQRALAVNRGALTELEGIAGAFVTTNTLGEPPFARESSTTAITYLFFPPEVGQTERIDLAERFIDTQIEPDPGATVGVTGAVAARDAQSEEITDALPLVEAATVLLVGLVVGLHFRAIGAPIVNLLAVGLAYLTAIRLVAYIGQQIGVSVPSEVEPVIVVLLFGVITDYSIFFMSRFRQLSAEGGARRQAAEHATRELLPIVVTAGMTIILGSSALGFAELGFLQAFGPGMALSVAFGLLAAITFVPAVLAIAGPALFWPGGRGARVDASATEPGRERRSAPYMRPTRPRFLRRRPPRVDSPPRHSWRPFHREPPRVHLPRGRRSLPITLASRFPVTVALLSVAVLVAASTGLSKLDPANPLIRGLPADSEVKQTYQAAGEGFAPSILAPTVLIVEAPGITGRTEATAQLQRLLADRRGVAEVVGPGDQPLERKLGAVLSPTGDAVRYVVFFNADPLGGKAVRFLEGIRSGLPGLLERAGLGGAEVSIAGDTALVAETAAKTFDDLARIAPVIALVVLLVLALFLRALVAPLYLLAASVLALCASLGLTVYVFQDLLGYGEVTYYVPFAAAVLLVSLGSDYNVFLVGRIWNDARVRPIREAIVTGGSSAARSITAAGLVLAGSFALLALVPVRSFRELAFAMCVGLLIDAFVVRTLLVPALMSLAGTWSAWPSRRLLRVEPAADRSGRRRRAASGP